MKKFLEKSLPGTVARIAMVTTMALFVCEPFGNALGGILNGSFNTIPSGTAINLTAAGPVDWVHWGLHTYTSLDRKTGVTPQISNFSLLSNGNSNAFSFVYQYSDNPNGYSWSDGTPNSSITNTTTGVWVYGLPQLGTGFEISVPADTSVRTLKLYIGVFAGQGRLVASLSDGSAASYSDTSLRNMRGTENGVYTIDFAANSAGQKLTISWSLLFFYQPSGNVTLQSAALTTATANNLPFVTIVSPTQNSTFDAGTNILVTANANDLDGPIAKVEFFDGAVKLATVFSSPYEFTWSNVPAGLHVLKAIATDTNADFSSSMPVEIFINGTGGSLSATSSVAPSQLDLTKEGTNDWAHWGLSNSVSFNHKAGVVQQISDLIPIGTNLFERLTDNVTACSWSDGTPVSNANNTTSGVFIRGTANGFELHAPADTTLRRLKIYAGLYGAQGNFQAYLSDFSAKPFTDTSLSNFFNNSYSVYTLDYTAASDGQSLIIRYRALNLFDQEFGNVTFQAATLTGTSAAFPNTPPTVSISSPTNGESFLAPGNITMVASAFDDGSVANVEFYNGAMKLGESTNSPYTFVWNNVASGAYSLTARATDNFSVSSTSAPVYITVTNGTNNALQLRYEVFLTNGARALKIFPSIAQPYSLEASPYLSNWTSIFTNQTGSSASNYIETPLTNRPGRFYRGKQWP
jgi:hypothetical protein